MSFAPWFWYVAVALIAWGVAGLLQKLSTNQISAESALIWLTVGFLLFQPWLYPGRALANYSGKNLAWGLLGGFLNAFGSWALLAAMKKGGKAAIVVPLTALYPLVVVVAAPILLHESITRVQAAGVLCALGAVVLFST